MMTRKNIKEMTAQDAIILVSSMVKVRYIAQVIGGNVKYHEVLLSSGKNNSVRNNKPYEFTSDIIEKFTSAIVTIGNQLLDTRILNTSQSAEEYPLCYGEDYVSKFKNLRKTIVLSYIFETSMGKTARWQKMHLSDKSETRYYNQFTDEEISEVNSTLQDIALTLLSISVIS